MFESLRRKLFSSRNGEPIVVVSGLPRSGTSMMMRMLEAGGIGIMTDAEREPDIDNPKGYFERAAKRAVKKYKFKPRVEDGVPVASPGEEIVISFELEE